MKVELRRRIAWNLENHFVVCAEAAPFTVCSDLNSVLVGRKNVDMAFHSHQRSGDETTFAEGQSGLNTCTGVFSKTIGLDDAEHTKELRIARAGHVYLNPLQNDLCPSAIACGFSIKHELSDHFWSDCENAILLIGVDLQLLEARADFKSLPDSQAGIAADILPRLRVVHRNDLRRWERLRRDVRIWLRRERWQ